MIITQTNMAYFKILMGIIIFLPMSSCTITDICVHNENGSTCTVDSSTTATPTIDPTIDVPSEL